MGINRVAKGRRAEKECEDILIKLGFLTWRTYRAQFHPLDFMGYFDVVGFRKDGMRKYISVKSEGCSTLKEIARIREFRDAYGKEGESYELWIRRRGGWRIYENAALVRNLRH